MTFEARADIDLAAIAHNFEAVRSLAPDSRIMAVIKANAYGHGAVEVARSLDAADAFGVARLSEGVALRVAGISLPICLLEGVNDASELVVAREYDLDLVVHASHQIELLESSSPHRIWLKVNTGMSRLGFPVSETSARLQQLSAHQVQGLITHLARADESDGSATLKQLELLSGIDSRLDLSIANSAGVLNHTASHRSWVRPGLMLYGASPNESAQPLKELRAAMTFTAPIIAVREVKQGEYVGYGGTWQAMADCRLAVLAVGYADGYPREVRPGTSVLVNGHRRDIVGRVSMDMLSVLLGPDDVVAIGDHFTLWGVGLPIEEIATAAGTIAYTLMCGVSARVKRRYVGVADGQE